MTKETDVKLIPDFASMTEEERFKYLKFSVVRLFILYMFSMSLAKADGPLWLDSVGQAVVFVLFSHAAIAMGRGILFLERRSKKQAERATASEP